jgi:hypothetical protein
MNRDYSAIVGGVFLEQILEATKNNKQVIIGKSRNIRKNWSNYNWLNWFRAQQRKEKINKLINKIENEK